MISVELATALRDAGLVWHPQSGDRFVLTRGTFDGEVFTLSDMVVQAHEAASGAVLAFNGTTEWALDSTSADDALWLPREDQLRTLLSYAFVRLEVVGDGYAVELTDGSRHVDIDAERAYARAAIAWLGRRRP